MLAFNSIIIWYVWSILYTKTALNIQKVDWFSLVLLLKKGEGMILDLLLLFNPELSNRNAKSVVSARFCV